MKMIKKNKHFTVVMRGPSSVIFRQNERLMVENFPTENGPVKIGYCSRWIKREGIDIPGHIWIEINGSGEKLEKSLAILANAGLAILPYLSLSANAAIGEPDVEIGFDSTPNISKRDYFQNYVSPETGIVYLSRPLHIKSTIALINTVSSHPESKRLHRAANQYRLALDSWQLGRASLSLAHLWMALEALTKSRIRAECRKRNISGEPELAKELGVKLEQLDSIIRKDLILKGDRECYRKAKKASDGFEHGFLGFEEIRELSQDVRVVMAKLIRNAILELCELKEEDLKILTSNPFNKPMGHWPIVKYMRGQLLGKGELAAKGNSYPFIRWKSEIKKYEIKDHIINIEPSDTFTAEIGKGISFQPKSVEYWRLK